MNTPGLWFVGVQNDILYIIDRAPRPSNDDVNPNQDIEPIAKVYKPREGTFEAELANAQLLATAPDLLAACEKALSLSDNVFFRRELEAVIAKVRQG